MGEEQCFYDYVCARSFINFSCIFVSYNWVVQARFKYIEAVVFPAFVDTTTEQRIGGQLGSGKVVNPVRFKLEFRS